MKENIIAIVPARGGSKRIPKKNIRKVCGKPLIFYSIRVAQLVQEVKSLFISTEDEEIAKIGSSLGAIYLPRPDHLSEDHITNFQVMQHAVSFIEETYKYEVDLLMLLQPTSPFRTPTMLKKAIKMIIDAPEDDSLITVRETRKTFGQIADGHWVASHDLPHRLSNSKLQYVLTGDVLILRTKNTLQKGVFLGKRIRPMVLDQEHVDIDIDYPQDLYLAERLFNHHREKYSFFEIN